MDRAVLPRRLLACLGLAWLAFAGCAVTRPSASPSAVLVDAASSAEAPAVMQASHDAPAPAVAKEVPVTLDAVLRFAEQSNAKVGRAREKLAESQIEQEQAQHCWMPNVYAGAAYYRHEGGIQNENGTFTHSSTGALYPGLQIRSELDLRKTAFEQIDAERKVWQQKAELSQVNSEVLLEAAQAYVDLLTARRAEALARELEQYERKVLARAEILAKVDQAVDSLTFGLRSSVASREYQQAQLRQQGDAASAKLVYLLGLPPLTKLVPVDPVFVPVELVDVASPEMLVDRVQLTGPGVRELVGLLDTIQGGLDASYGKRNLLPTVELCVWEGLFGAGPGGSLTFDNRLDVGLQLKWNLTALLRAEEQRKLVRSKLEQTRWTLKDVKDRLAAGVQEATTTIKDSREMLGHGVRQIQEASRAYQKADDQLEEGIKGVTPAAVVTAIRALELAHFNYVQATREHNKAQVRLLLLVGHGPAEEKKLAPQPRLDAPTPLRGPRPVPPSPKAEEDERLPPPKEVRRPTADGGVRTMSLQKARE